RRSTRKEGEAEEEGRRTGAHEVESQEARAESEVEEARAQSKARRRAALKHRTTGCNSPRGRVDPQISCPNDQLTQRSADLSINCPWGQLALTATSPRCDANRTGEESTFWGEKRSCLDLKRAQTASAAS